MSNIIAKLHHSKCAHSSIVSLLFIYLSWINAGVAGRSSIVQISSCRAIINGLPINLEPLSAKGKPRFEISTDMWQWAYNPCSPYNLPEDPYEGGGEKCFSVFMCQSIIDQGQRLYYTAGIKTTAVITTRPFPQVGHRSLHRRRLLAVNDDDSKEKQGIVDGEEEPGEKEESTTKNPEEKDETEIEIDVKNEEDDDEEDQGNGPGEEDDEEDDEEEEDDDDDDDEGSGKKGSSSSDEGDSSDDSREGGAGQYEDNLHMPVIIFKALKTSRVNRKQKVFVYLQCDKTKVTNEDATFTYIPGVSMSNHYFQLSHLCCCPGGCPNGIPNIPGNYNNDKNATTQEADLVIIKEVSQGDYAGPRLMWLILVVNIGILACAVMIGGMCCRKSSGSGPYYNMLPAIHSSRMTINSTESYPAPVMKSPELLDYTTSILKKQQLPVTESGLIDHRDLEIRQRLGGGIFGDTYIAEWKERKVAAKRITVGVHRGQLNDSDVEWIIKEIFHLSKQRHKFLASMLGICVETKLPYVISEFIEGESLRDAARRNEEQYPIHRKIKLCMQVADGIAFLHSAKHPIIHRDLRGSNVIVDYNDKIKIVDYGLTRLLQRLRQGCTGRKECFCQKDQSAYPPTIRWTAPEILVNPTVDEYHGGGVISPACDVYSFGMVLWEVVSGTDPYDEIQDESEIIELVLQEVRPNLENLHLVPQLKEVIRACWQQDPDDRPSIKQTVSPLKSVVQVYTKLSAKRNPRKRNDSSTVSYLKSALNMYTD